MRKFLPYLFLVLATTVSGALLENPKRLQARYGKTMDVVGDPNVGGLRTYYWKKLKVVVNVVGWKSREESYSHRNESPLTGTEVKELLELNALGSVWQKQTQTGEARWMLANTKAVAVYPEKEGRHLLQVSFCATACPQPSLWKQQVIRLADAEVRNARIDLKKFRRPEVHYNQFSQDDTWFLWYVNNDVTRQPKFADAFSVTVHDKTRKVSVALPAGLRH